jgi:hypothetical protein
VAGSPGCARRKAPALTATKASARGPPSAPDGTGSCSTAVAGSLSADRPFLLWLDETERSSVAVARPDYIQPLDDSAMPDALRWLAFAPEDVDRAAIFVPAAQTAETA